MKSRKTGSITIYMSLLLMVVASLLFTLLEVSRYLALEMTAVINSQSVTESMFAEYHIPAYQNYHLFLMDSSYGSGQLLLSKVNQKMQELGQENLNPAVIGLGRYHNFLQMDVTDSSVVQYELATDQHAEPLLWQISKLMKKEIAADLAEAAYQKITNVQETGEQGKKADRYLDGAIDTIGQAKEEKERENQQQFQMRSFRTGTDESAGSEEDIENPMDPIKQAKNSPLLAQILSKDTKISAKAISKQDAVEKRELNVGNFQGESVSVVSDKIMILQYLKKYMSNYKQQRNIPHALNYEQEYLLFGKSSDEENLKKMASRLLLVREGINFAYLMTDHAKCEEAFAAATAIAAAAGIPAAVKAIQMGILASWAYAESIAEMRTLFEGGMAASVKTSENWTVSLAEAALVPFQTSVKSKEVQKGLDYEDYLQAFLAIESLKKIGERLANLLEKNFRLYTGYDQIKMDHMITAMETSHRYQARQVFLTFVTIARLSKKGYQYETLYRFSYTPEKDSE